MCNWYKHDIPAWLDGTGNLSNNAYRIYHFVCQQIYLNEGPIVLNERGIAGQCNLRIDRFRVYLKELIDLGKLSVVDDKLTNGRCSKELAQIETNRVNAGKGGRSPRRSVSDSSPTVLDEVSDSSRTPLDDLSDSSPHGLVYFSDANLLKNKELGGATLQNVLSLKTRLEKTREESKKDAADAAPEVLKAPDARVYARGREVLGKEAGGLIKKLITAKEGNLALAMAAIETASTKHQPREYIGKIIAGQGDRYDDLCPRTFSSFTVR